MILPATHCAIACILAAGAAPDDEWPRYGHDARLTGRSALAGDITEPRVAWTCPLASREYVLELVPAPGEHRATLSAREEPAGGSAPAPPTIERPGLALVGDIDGSGTPRPCTESFHERWAKVLPDVRGLQRVAWSHTWTDQKVCRLELFAYDRGHEEPRKVWGSDPPEATIFSPLDIIADIDRDGVQEICVAAHYRIMIFEGTTGRKETELRYHACRPYGWFGLVDVDGKEGPELVTIGDFQSHIDVIAYDPARPEPERLSVIWRCDIETAIEERTTWPQVGPRPVVDVTGDRLPEIVVNLFNGTGDGEWHVVVLDARSGATVCDLPRRFLAGTADANGDGAADLFLASASGAVVHRFGRAEIVAVIGGSPAALWSREGASWATADLPRLGGSWSTTAAQGMRDLLIAPRESGSVVLIRELTAGAAEPAARSAIVALECARGAPPREIWRVDGFAGEAEPLVLAPGAGAVVRVALPGAAGNELAGRGAQVRVLESNPLSPGLSPPVAARLKPGGPIVVAAEAGGRTIAAIEPPRSAAAGAPRILWQRPGRGMADGSRVFGLLAADLDGDGGSEVVAADQAALGHALLVAYRGDGSILWRQAFERVPGAPPVWNVGALTFWWPGRFRSPDAVDLFVTTRRGPMHSDVGQLLDGRTGETVWMHEKAIVPGQFRWGYAGIAVGVADMDGDRCEDLVNLYPVCFWIASGKTGAIAVGAELASQKKLPAWAAYGEPLVADFTRDGKLDVLLDSEYILALMDKAGEPIWHATGRISYPVSPQDGNLAATTRIKHALCDFDGDGVPEIGSGGYGDGVRAIDPRDGTVLWSLGAPAPTGPRVVAANIDGRNGDELIYPAGDSLVAVTGDRKAGRVLWTWKGPAALSLPAIADLDGDGRAEIVVQDARGDIHCLAQASPAGGR